MNSSQLLSAVDDGIVRRRCRCHACRLRRTLELRRALEGKFGGCRTYPLANGYASRRPRVAAAR